MKKLLILFLLAISGYAHAQNTVTFLSQEADTIATETKSGANTAKRIGRMNKNLALSTVNLLGSYPDPSWLTSLSSSKLIGNFSISNFNSGTGANSLTSWFGDGTWKPALSNSLSPGNIFVGNISSIASAVAMSGDGTLSSSGTLSVTKILGNTIPANASGVLTNNGSGSLSWAAAASSFATLTDGNISSPTNLQLLQFQTGDSKWHNINPPTWNQNTTGTSAGWTTGRTLSITGDLAYTSPSIDGTGNVTAAGTLATVNSNTGSWGTATQSPQFTVNGKGLITAAANVTITPAISSITGLGTGAATALGVNTGSAGAFVVNGGALGTPSSGTLTNATGLPISSGISGLASGIATWLATPNSANLASALTDETGSGAAVFGTSPTLATPIINGLPTGTGISSSTTASTVVTRDANSNIQVNNAFNSYTTTSMAGGTTALTIASSRFLAFTGSTSTGQTVTMPDVTTLPKTGCEFVIYNQNTSTGTVIVQSFGANTIQTVYPGSMIILRNNALSGTSASSWDSYYTPKDPSTSDGDMLVRINGIWNRIVGGSNGQVLTWPASGFLPSWQAAGGGLSGSSGQIPVMNSGTTAAGSADFTYSTASRSLHIGPSTSGTNTIDFGTTGTGFTVNNSTGENRNANAVGFFPTYYSNNVERMRINSSGNGITGNTASSVFRTTNTGSDVNAHWIFDPASSLTSGKAYGFESTNGFIFTQGNGTRRIMYGAIQGVNLTTTAGSEAGDIAILSQSAGGAASTVATFSTANSNVSMKHLKGSTSAPTIVAGTGAGTSPTVSISGTDLSGIITVTTGTTPSGSNAIIATITFNVAYSNAPVISLTAANRAANGLIGSNQILVPANGQANGVTTTTFVIESNTVALTGSTTYLWTYQAIQ